MKILIVGGTGSLGKELVKKYYNDKNDITILSRDELKQSQMMKTYPDCRYILADIRDGLSLEPAFDAGEPYDVVFHCAALKHVDLGESNVDQFVRTNYNGVVHVLSYCKLHSASTRFVYFTTDKAVLPINAYGMSKALAEKYLQQEIVKYSLPIFIFRWGNILGSRGSVIDHFKNCLINKKQIPITSMDCTRFWLLLDEAVKFVDDTLFHPKRDQYSADVYIPKMKAASVTHLIAAIYSVLENKGIDLLPLDDCRVEVGLRPGEKIHEHITHVRTSKNSEQYGIFELMKKIERLDIW